MKKAVGIISLALCAVFVQPAQAADEKVIAVIDSAIDSSKNASIIYEVCINIEHSTCNNSKFQEGKGSANVSNWKIAKIDHGFNTVQVINNFSPNTKIVFIRTAEITPSNTLRLDARSYPLALKWISENASKYSIDAVSISQSNTDKNTYTDLTCPTDTIFDSSKLSLMFKSSISSLKQINVPTFIAAGNHGNKTQIGFPGCAKDVIPVASLNPLGQVSNLSNYSSAVRIVANECAKFNGNICVKTPDYAGVPKAQSGTSIATPLAVAKLIDLWTGGDWNTLINSLPKNGTAGQIK